MEDNPDSILNLKYLNRLMETTFAGLGKDSFGELIDIYEQESLDMIRSAVESLHMSSFTETRKLIHSLKGASANMGAALVVVECKVAESKLDSELVSSEEIQKCLQKLSELVPQSVMTLKQYLHGL